MMATALESLAANLPATLVALGGLLVSIGTLYKSIQNGKKADRAAAVAVVAERKVDAVAAETSTIKTNTDGSLSEQRHKIELLEQQIKSLEAAASVANAARELAAHGVALNTPVPPKEPTE